MSEFKVELKRIARAEPHPNTDRLDLCRVEGLEYQFVTGRGEYKAGDWVVYFPVDSILPDKIIGWLDLNGKLHGPQKNRLKTIKLRGCISQGLVCKPEAVGVSIWMADADLSEYLGVVKYEPPEKLWADAKGERAGFLKALPMGVSVYDIESCDRYATVVRKLLESEEDVHITEKLEGANYAVTANDDGVFVSQRRYSIAPLLAPNHPFWVLTREKNLDTLVRELRNLYNRSVTIRGEFVGPNIQGNHYRLKEHRVYIFDILVGERYMTPRQLWETALNMLFLDMLVPEIAYNITLAAWLNGRTVQESSDGNSAINPDVRREGIVIKPCVEQWHPSIGRLVLKQRGPEYLAKCEL